MIFERIKSEGIAHNSYLLGSGNDAIVIDPRRDCQVYADSAREKGLRIRYIFETHRNEDYVVGSTELKRITGAEIYHGPGLNWKYGTTLKDGQVFQIDEIELTAICTPGHTDESMSFVIADMATGKNPTMVFTGDTLFVGDVGRTDLCGPKEVKRMASNLYDSIFNRLLPLGDSVIICPAHGGGSVCGMHIADRDESTIGLERLHNPALQKTNKAEFVKNKVSKSLKDQPILHKWKGTTREDCRCHECMASPVLLTANEFKKEMDEGAIVVDTSEPAAFGGIHIKGAYSIWVEGLPAFAGWVLPYDKPILLILEDQSNLEKAIRYLYREGYDQVRAYLNGGIESWYNAGFPMESLSLLPVYELKSMLDKHEQLTILDTRGQEEWESGHIEGALHIYVGHLEQRLSEVPRGKPVAVYCETGHRAGLSASILLRAGYPKVYNVPGSITAWVAAGYPIVKD